VHLDRLKNAGCRFFLSAGGGNRTLRRVILSVDGGRFGSKTCQKSFGIPIDIKDGECASTETLNYTAMNVKPLSDRVLILPNPAEEKTAGGLFIPDTAKEKPLAGKVVAVGPGTSEIKMEVKEGDQVLYGKYAGQEINIDGTDYLIMKQQDILAII